ncbi:MarR family winged helix-turn-helix transcriptional regulator [Paenibacillus macquariensis]|uniref:Transcriptional regulator, MarR family n=1 Tax=Paenibacillus macquariensis TaxID=948756 RepID=A0ABY1JNU8_9BACL|nr:MarR family transcriptional regulator [Paenibacillus macquariensis]MEC0092100.1 MarR family transcriptional regulator [Paenibacillus macquariensis]OAB37337.1 MarR family transcriptional regulator [Paenibacillus macquariensis subsp. macquariensis]SIQ51116.1 transcriptional regulator, MarR family [Paenibacillus macquariensis]
MENKNIAEQINQTIKDIWMILEKKERAYTNFKLNNQQIVLLTLAIRHPFSSPSELAEKMDITKSAVSQQLAKLEKDGYIIRKQDVEDKRAFLIELGEKGMLYKKEMEAFNQQVSERYHANLSLVELTNMLSALQKLPELLE